MQVTTRDALSTTEIDRHVGERIRQRRVLLGYTQEQLASVLDISYQQIQKYETGANRVSAGRLFQIARHLGVSTGSFFERLENGLTAVTTDQAPEASDRQVIELVRQFQSITDADVRSAVLALARSLNRNGRDIDAADICMEEIDAGKGMAD